MDDASDAERTVEVESVLAVLDDPDCRTMLRTLVQSPGLSAQDLSERCDLARTTAYRKVDGLVAADLVRTTTELRDDGHHTTRYIVAFDDVTVSLSGDGEFDVAVERPESPDERLARFWSAMRESR